ncbi:MAG: hypothetical protein HZA54_04655 [Planctomycetes bacterium]|nr:hypothetical protein [Planctomycetota bacterium]
MTDPLAGEGAAPSPAPSPPTTPAAVAARRERRLDRWLGLGVGVVAAALLAVLAAEESAAPADGRRAPRPYEDDVAPWRAVDPALVRFHEERSWPTGLDEARGFALCPDGGFVVVGDRALCRFAADGRRSAEWPLPGPPECVALDAAGVAWIGYRDRVEARDAAGSVTAAWAAPGSGAHLTALAVTADTVWLADAAHRVVLRCTPGGRLLGRLGLPDAAAGIPGLVVPSPYLDVALGADGAVYVSNPGRHRIEAYAPDGRLLRAVGGFSMRVDGFCGCCNPVALAVRPDGVLIAAEKGIARVKLLNPVGVVTAVVAPPAAFSGEAFGRRVACDGAGRVFVLDSGSGAVRVFAPQPEETDGPRIGK